jgi:hypothetical protein
MVARWQKAGIERFLHHNHPRMKCDKCGLESENRSMFKTEHEPFSKRRTLCLSCQNAKETKVLKAVFWIPIFLGLIGVFLTLLHPGSRATTLMINFMFIAIGGIVVSFMHEMGHAIVGKLAGFRIFALEIGIGQLALEFKRFGIRWRLRKVPLGGRVFGLPLDIRGFRLRQTLFVLGGPMVTAILFLLAWKCRWVDLMLDQTRFSGLQPMRLLLIMNGAVLIACFVPHRASGPEGRIPNDALNIWLTWKLTPQTIANLKSAYYCFEAEECRREHTVGEAIMWLDKGLREVPGNHALNFARATYLVFENRLQEARQALLGLRNTLANDKAYFPLLLNNIAYVDALLGSPELLDEADDYSQQALSAAPCFVYFKGTRGLVLAQRGRFDDGIPLLKEALRDHPEKWGKAINACCLGIAAQQQGNLDESRSYFALARKLDPLCPLLDRCP